MYSTTYVNLSGGAIMNVLDCIKIPVIKSVYIDARFKVPRECVKQTYPVSERLMCITSNSPALDIQMYDTFHIKIEWEVLKIYDYNTDKQVFQILLNDKELARVQCKLKTLKSCIDNNAGLVG